MTLSFAYAVIKDVAKLAKLKTGPDIDVGRMSLEELRAAGTSGLDDDENAYRWVSPRNLLARTNEKTGVYDVVFVQSGFRERSRLVRNNSSGRVASILCRRRDG